MEILELQNKDLTPLQKKKLLVLQDTVNYYSENVQRRNMSGMNEKFIPKEQCYYSANSTGKDTQGCAVGRLLSRPLALEIDTKYPNGVSITTLMQGGKIKLPKKILELGANFLQALQMLHDVPSNWDEGLNKLTGKGEVMVQLMVKAVINNDY